MISEIAIDGPQKLLGKDGKTEYVIREVTMRDLNAVIEINRKVLPENYPPWFFVEHIEQYPKAFIVAEVGGKVVGYVMSRVEFGWSYIAKGKTAKKGHIVSVGVLPEARRLGIATAMLVVAPIQGATYLDLLRRSARELSQMGFPIYAVGSPTTLLEEYRFDTILEIVLEAKMAMLSRCKAAHTADSRLTSRRMASTAPSACWAMYKVSGSANSGAVSMMTTS